MKIKVKELKYEDVLKEEFYKPKKPKTPNIIFRTLMRLLSNKDLKSVNFKYTDNVKGKISKKENMLILMNHSSFIDLEIASKILYPRKYNIICTDDGFVGKEWLMKNLGCIPTRKFISDPVLVKDMLYAKGKLKNSILLYPEASYSFDGTKTPLPKSLAKAIKFLKMPVVMIKTNGAFLRDPLYNNLQIRKVEVNASFDLLLSLDDIDRMDYSEIYKKVDEAFNFDNFKYQKENGIQITEPFRADFLNRILYKCPHCLKEGMMEGKGTNIRCLSCGVEYTLTTDGTLKNLNGNTIFDHIPSWYKWEREEVKKEIIDKRYKMDLSCDIIVLKNFKNVYRIGEGRLNHDINGFHLTNDNLLDYYQSPLASYSLYSDYYWYEIGDVICIGDDKMRYYCFPKEKDVVSKARLAVEEIYKYLKEE